MLTLSFSSFLLLFVSLHLPSNARGAFRVRHLFQGHELALPALHLAFLSLFCSFDGRDDFIKQALAKYLLIDIDIPTLAVFAQLLIVGQCYGNTFPLEAAEGVYLST